MLGIFKEVLRLIDAHDVLFSDSMNEFDRFAFAYLIMKKFGITDPVQMKTPGKFANVLANLKRKRIFENLPVDADIKFLTKDIPTQFIQFMKDALREQIHIQSHIPDFTSDKMAGASGKAIKRLLFDFENLVSSSDADFDLGLIERINLITKIYELTGRATGTSNDFIITHKRNLPDDTLENAQVAGMLKAAGMSSYLVTSSLGSELCPDVQAELLRQQKEAEELMEMNPLGTDIGLDEMSAEEDISEGIENE
jgi:SPP1 family phage portal protein